MASGDTAVRVGGEHRRHGHLQLGRLRERHLLAGVLLLRGLLQRRLEPRPRRRAARDRPAPRPLPPIGPPR